MLEAIALDLEGTLISSAVSQIPRPGLYEFLEHCRGLCPRVVIFTAVSDPWFREIAERLVADGLAPASFAEIEYVAWSGPYKDLRFIPNAGPECCLLVDDLERYIEPSQLGQWIAIEPFDRRLTDVDEELPRVSRRLESWCNES